MSTKAIRKVLRDMQCDYNPCLTGMCRKHEALSEVEAIERAAKVVAVQGVFEHPDDDAYCLRGIHFAEEVMESIAKDAP